MSDVVKEKCPLCGFLFAADEAACSGCAMMRGCSMLKCPNCRYEFTVASSIVKRVEQISKWFKERKKHHVTPS